MKFYLIILLVFMTSSIAAQTTKKADALVIKVFNKTKDKTLWVIYYIVIENKVYSGDNLINNHIFECRSLDGYLDSIPNNTFLVNELYSLKMEMIKIQLKGFKTKIPHIDNEFYWSSIIVPIEYIDLPFKIVKHDFLKFLYTEEYNALYMKKIDLKKMEKGHFPKFILNKMIANEKCLKVLVNTYFGFEDCLEKP